jgi:hypothetical protein
MPTTVPIAVDGMSGSIGRAINRGGAMHRRQFLPGSDRKVSRARLAQQNRALINLHNETARRQAEAQELARKQAEQKANSGIRGFVNRAKKWLKK